LKKQSRIIAEEEEPEGQKNIYKNKYEELFERLTKLLWFNKLEIGKRKVSKAEVCEELGVNLKQFNKFLKLPPKKAEETLSFRDKIKEEEQKHKDLEKAKKKDPYNILGKR